MSNTGWAAVIIVLIILLGGGWWWYSMQQPASTTTTTTTTAGTPDAQTPADTTGAAAQANIDVSAGAGANAANTTTIHFTASGFSPKSVTINKGQSVAWVNDTSGGMWVASNAHPLHTGYDGTDRTTHCSGTYAGPTPFDECQSGNTYTFVFSKAGTFGFHNHDAAQFEGTVVVK